MIIKRFEKAGAPRWREIRREGRSVTLVTGVEGTSGLAQVEELEDEAQAVALFDEKVAGYLANGYVELDEATAVARRAAAGEPMMLEKPTPEERERLEAARRALGARSEQRLERQKQRDAERAERERQLEAARAERAQRRAERTRSLPAIVAEWPRPPRRLERISDGAIWSIAREGHDLYVGSEPLGRERIEHRTLAGEEEAARELERLVTERLQRGYVEHVARPRADEPASDRDGEARAAPRPAIAPAPEPRPPVDAARAFEAMRRTLRRLGARWRTEKRPGVPEVTAPILARFADEAKTPEPLDRRGEALCAVMLEHRHAADDPEAMTAPVDFWVATKGVAFAFEVLGDLHALGVFVSSDGEAYPAVGVHEIRWDDRLLAWARLRDHLAAADDEGYAAARRLMRGRFESSAPRERAAFALAFPRERSLVAAAADAVLAFPDFPAFGACLLGSLEDGERALRVVERLPHGALASCAAYVHGLVDAAGALALPALGKLLDRASAARSDVPTGMSAAPLRRATAQALGRIGTADAAALLEGGLEDADLLPGLVISALHAPALWAERILAAASAGGEAATIARSLLTWVLRKHPELSLRPGGAGARREIGIARARAAQVEAEPEGSPSIPASLAAPPWRGGVPLRRRPRVEIAPPDGACELSWRPGEEDAWKARWRGLASFDGRREVERDAACEERFDALRAAPVAGRCDPGLLLEASTSVALAAWNELDASVWTPRSPALSAFVARHGGACLRGLVAYAAERRAEALELLAPLAAAGAARVAAAGLGDEPDETRAAEAWLGRHPEAAARALSSDAAGAAGPDRDRADAALRWLVAHGHEGTAVATARALGAEALLEHVLADDPGRRLPEIAPVLPAFWDGAALPAVRLRATGRALPAPAIEALGEMLMLGSLAAPYTGLDEVRDDCMSDDLADLGREIATRWLVAGEPREALWALGALAHFADVESVRLAAHLLRRWDERADRARADHAVDVLARAASAATEAGAGAGGADVLARLHLVDCARHGRDARVREGAERWIARLAKRAGVTPEELADRSVPDLGLGPDGSITLDFGPRAFRVGLDEHLTPFVHDGGARMPDLPPPSPSDDPEKAADAGAAWRALKREVTRIAALTIDRLEEAMIARRGIGAPAFGECFQRHRLVGQVARRVLWSTDEGALFRIAEDGTLADAEDAAFGLAAGALVRVAHPVDLAPQALALWRARLADYEILQPFAQLDRAVHRVPEAERAATELLRFTKRSLARAQIDALLRRGFTASAPHHPAGSALGKALPSGRRLCLWVEPGLFSARPAVRLERVWFEAAVDDAAGERVVPLGAIDPIEYSEAVIELDELVTPGD